MSIKMSNNYNFVLEGMFKTVVDMGGRKAYGFNLKEKKKTKIMHKGDTESLGVCI